MQLTSQNVRIMKMHIQTCVWTQTSLVPTRVTLLLIKFPFYGQIFGMNDNLYIFSPHNRKQIYYMIAVHRPRLAINENN